MVRSLTSVSAIILVAPLLVPIEQHIAAPLN
jgi:hypothetical protein